MTPSPNANRNPTTRWLAHVLLVAGLLALAPALEARTIQVSGRIVNAAGEGVEGVAVRVIQGRRDFQVREWSFSDEMTDAFLTRTDGEGFYEAELTSDPEYRYFWLRFYEPGSFDDVRYRRPDDVDISRKVRGGRRVVRQVTLEDHPDWPRVHEWIARLGEESDRARLVRGLGFDRHEEIDGVESFWYTRRGTVFRFQGDRFLSEERLETRQAEAAGSSGS